MIKNCYGTEVFDLLDLKMYRKEDGFFISCTLQPSFSRAVSE